ncbi:MAG: hypothetical protein AAB492_00025 [Patescibacteria group bacterium]
MVLKQVYIYAVLFFMGLSFASIVKATSPQAYQDFQFQFDIYRQIFGDYRVALGEFKKYSSLASEQMALDKAKQLIGQRNQVARAYFLFLNEKLTENPSMPPAELDLYHKIITNEIAFLDQETSLAPSLSSLADVEKVSQEFIKHYPLMQSAFRQVIIATQLGYLRYFAKQFDTVASEAQALVNANRSAMTDTKRATLDRWILALSNKRSLYQQKVDGVRTGAFKLNGDVADQDRKFIVILQDLTAARQYLIEGSSFFTEVENALRYDD